jgi:hypothetical protein
MVLCLADQSLNSVENLVCVGRIQLIYSIYHCRYVRGGQFQIVEHLPPLVVPEGLVDQNQLWGGFGVMVGHLLNICGPGNPIPVMR